MDHINDDASVSSSTSNASSSNLPLQLTPLVTTFFPDGSLPYKTLISNVRTVVTHSTVTAERVKKVGIHCRVCVLRLRLH